MGKLILLFVLMPAIELTLLIELGKLIGTFPTLALIAVTGVVGASLARLQGLSVLRQTQSQLSRGELPADSLADGVMILVAGALLITPGVLTDALGFSLLVPAFRSVIKKLLWARFQKAVQQNRVHWEIRSPGFDDSSGRSAPGDEGGPVYDVYPEPQDGEFSPGDPEGR